MEALVGFVAQAVRGRWRTVLLVVVAAVVVAAFAHPDWGVHDYRATHVLTVPSASRAAVTPGAAPPATDPFALKPDAIVALATSQPVLKTVAGRLGYDGPPLRLSKWISARYDRRAGTIEITATVRDGPAAAVALANGVATATIESVDGSRAIARQAAIDQDKAVADDLFDQITHLDPANPVTNARRNALIGQYVATNTDADRLRKAPPTSGLSTARPATARQLPGGLVAQVPPALGWMLTLMVFSGLGAGAAVAMELTDDRVRDAAAASGATGLAVLAVVNGDHNGGGGRPAAYEALRRELDKDSLPKARPSFAAPAVAGPGRVVLFTAPAAADGDTTDAVADFAGAVAAAGRSALIIDCGDADDVDSNGQRGLGDVIVEGIIPSSLAPLAQPTSIPRVSLVPRGRVTADAADFVARHPDLVRSAMTLADVVIVHGPPVLDATTTPKLASIAHETVLVCRTRRTSGADARRASAQLYDAGARVGLVVIDAGFAMPRPTLDVKRIRTRLRRDARLRGRLEWVGAGVAMLVMFVMLRSFVFESFSIPSPSMVPFLEPGDHVLVSRLSYHLHAVHRGDVIVFNAPKSATALQGEQLIKRVIGLPGETVESRDGHMFVNGKQLRETYLPKATVTIGVKPLKLPKGRYWVMGDNRTNSADSRFFGTISRGSIIGRAFFHIWPWPIGFM